MLNRYIRKGRDFHFNANDALLAHAHPNQIINSQRQCSLGSQKLLGKGYRSHQCSQQ